MTLGEGVENQISVFKSNVFEVRYKNTDVKASYRYISYTGSFAQYFIMLENMTLNVKVQCEIFAGSIDRSAIYICLQRC